MRCGRSRCEAATAQKAERVQKVYLQEDQGMPVIQRTETCPASGAISNTVNGSVYEFARTPQAVTLGVTQAATGLFCTINSGPDTVAEEFEPAILTRYAIVPDEMYYNDIMSLGDRLVVRIRNSTAGAIIVRTLAQLVEIR
jgi:hypothetical protein